MANSVLRQTVLLGLLDEVAIPYESLVVADINANPVGAHFVYKPAATAEQIALGDSILAAFDWRKRVALDRNTVVTALQQLTTQQQNTILRQIAGELLRTNAPLAGKIAAAVGVPLVVDQVDPN